MELSDGMRKALLQIGFGVTARVGGFFDEANERVDVRSAQALLERRLITYYVTGGSPMRGALELTEAGEELFEEIRERVQEGRR